MMTSPREALIQLGAQLVVQESMEKGTADRLGRACYQHREPGEPLRGHLNGNEPGRLRTAEGKAAVQARQVRGWAEEGHYRSRLMEFLRSSGPEFPHRASLLEIALAMLTHVCGLNRPRHKAWAHSKIRTTIAVVIGAGLLFLCACAKNELIPTDTPLPARTAGPTRIATDASSSSPPPSIDLAIQGSGSIQVVHGETTIYTLTVQNRGLDPATGIVLTDVLANGLIPIWTQPAQPLCGRQERTVGCDVGALRAGDAATVTLDLSVGGTETLVTGTQLAGVTLDLPAFACAIDQDSTQPRVTCRLATLQPGANAQVRIGVNVDARITGSLAHTATVAANEIDASHSNNRATFTLTIGAAGPETVTASPTTTDLVLHSDGPSIVIAGRPFTYTFTITNRGALDATGVRFEDALPPATILNAYAPGLPLCEQRDDALTCYLRDLDSNETITFTLVITGHAGRPVSNQMTMDPDPLMPGWPICFVVKERTFLHIVNCEFGVLKPGRAAHVQLVLMAKGVQERMMTNTASVSANETDLNPLDNTNTATITVQVRADLLVRSGISGPAFAGQTLSYTLTIANAGPSDATEVVLVDTLSMGARLISAIPSQGEDCRIERDDSSTDTVICGLGRLRSGETAAVTIVAAVDESLTLALVEAIIHSASVVAEQTDPNPGNNELMESIPVSAGVED
jgi:uncharacterized repeat protein (TIGR01451 family)